SILVHPPRWQWISFDLHHHPSGFLLIPTGPLFVEADEQPQEACSKMMMVTTWQFIA
ncbi:hypothetical protein LINGRAHAP2_LOCUS33054, partial [Linum grandiflorum]